MWNWEEKEYYKILENIKVKEIEKNKQSKLNKFFRKNEVLEE